MSSFTEPLAYRATEHFRGGRWRRIEIEGQPGYEVAGARRVFEIDRPFAYGCGRTQRSFEIPAGFRTDLGSIPAIARAFLSPDDPWAAAYVLHDWLYREGARLGVTRAVADAIMWDAAGLPFRAYTESGLLVRVRCPALYRSAIYSAVRVGGGGSYLSGAQASQ